MPLFRSLWVFKIILKKVPISQYSIRDTIHFLICLAPGKKRKITWSNLLVNTLTVHTYNVMSPHYITEYISLMKRLTLENKIFLSS